MAEFENFTIDDIKDKYSSAGAVQKIMRRKKWWMPLYERANIPFESSKIIVNTKNMDKFTYSFGAHYSSGGGAGGQNFIYFDKEVEKEIIEFTSIADFTKFTNGVLNSKLIQKYIFDGQYNQLSTAKIGDIPFISLKSINKNKLYNELLQKIDFISEHNFVLDKIVVDFQSYLNAKYSLLLNESIVDDTFDLIELFSKNKINLTISEETEWIKYFNEVKGNVKKLKDIIYQTDKEIDLIVYELYGLSKKEINLVENANT